MSVRSNGPGATRRREGDDWFKTCDLMRARPALVGRLLEQGWWVKAISGGQAVLESPRLGDRQAILQIERPRAHSVSSFGTVLISVNRANELGMFETGNGWRATFVPSTPDDALELFLIAALEGLGEDAGDRERARTGGVQLNTGLLRYKLCPGCASRGPFRIRNDSWLLVSDREIKLIEVADELGPDLEFVCCACGRAGRVHELDRFKQAPPPRRADRAAEPLTAAVAC